MQNAWEGGKSATYLIDFFEDIKAFGYLAKDGVFFVQIIDIVTKGDVELRPVQVFTLIRHGNGSHLIYQ